MSQNKQKGVKKFKNSQKHKVCPILTLFDVNMAGFKGKRRLVKMHKAKAFEKLSVGVKCQFEKMSLIFPKNGIIMVTSMTEVIYRGALCGEYPF